MSRAQVVWLHIAVVLTTLTGAVFAFMKYAMESDDPFAVANHPMQPHVLAAHVVVAPVAVFVFGWIFGNHIWPGFTNPTARKKRSGSGTMWMLAPMILSGYLLQIATNETVRQAMSVAHWVSSGLFVVSYVVHVLIRVKNGNGKPAENGSATAPVLR